MAEKKQVYEAISAVMGELAKEGISKDRTNSGFGQGYKFRGIDDVYNTLAPKLVAHGLLLLPRYDGHVVSERGETKAGAKIYGATLVGHIDFTSVKDGSVHTVTVMGEAADQADKATNKAMSAAFKYACLQAFCIPTEGDNDADASHPEVKATKKEAADPVAGYRKMIDTAMSMDDLLKIAALAEKEAGLWSTVKPLLTEKKVLLERKVAGAA